MQNFVRNRDGAASLQGSHPKPSRQVIGANAKVHLKRLNPTEQPQQKPLQSSIPARGYSRSQLTAVPVQQFPARRLSGQDPKRDPYDTDTGSLDTTINQSVIRVEDSQKPQPLPSPRGEVADSENESGEESSEADQDEEMDARSDDEFGGFDSETMEYLQRYGVADKPLPEQISFLNQARRVTQVTQGFGTVEGDSYPTTTDGDWEEVQQPPARQDYDEQVSPSPQHPHTIESRPRTFRDGRNHNRVRSPNLFQQSANIRNEQRVNRDSVQQPRQSTHHKRTVDVPSSQPPTYSQVNPRLDEAHWADHPRGFTRNAPLGRAQPQPFKMVGNGRSDHVLPATTSVTNAQPTVPRQQVQSVAQQSGPSQTEDEAPINSHNIDYEREELLALKYDDLKNQSFDVNPRQIHDILPEGVSDKPLSDRLNFAKDKLDKDKQDDFFRSLSAREWEDAGDWFLDQFSGIVERMKKARQHKRKLAQDFEDEVEKRHGYVSKKQRCVEDAMSRMKAQGESLVDSPRRGRSPKPKKA